jgi:signal transduction histidine kinase/PAS domain-containing protein
LAEQKTEHLGLDDEVIEKIVHAKDELEILLDSISDIFMLLNKDGVVYRTNHAIQSWGLHPINQALGKNFHDLFHPECASVNCNIPAYWETAVEKIEKNQTFEYEIWDDSLKRHLIVKFIPVGELKYTRGLRDDVFAAAVFKDITLLKDAQLQMAQSTAEIKAILNASPDQHIRIQKDGTILSEIHKKKNDDLWPTPDFSKGNILDGLPTDVAKKFQESIMAVNLEKNNKIFEYSLILNNTEHFFEARLFPIFEDHILLINRNITESIRLKSMAESINYMKTLGYLFSGIRHEIGNPINSIKMSLMVIKKNMEKLPLERIGEYINRSLGEINRMEFLLQSFKNFNLYENVALKKMDLAKFLEDFFALMANDFESRKVALILSLDPDCDTVYSNSRALHQVLLNVVSNALDALTDMQEPTLEVSTSKAENAVQIKITDNGTGIHESILENLYKPFFTTKLNGTGLGLVIVKNILTRLSGNIVIESMDGSGTTVIISLPGESID